MSLAMSLLAHLRASSQSIKTSTQFLFVLNIFIEGGIEYGSLSSLLGRVEKDPHVLPLVGF